MAKTKKIIKRRKRIKIKGAPFIRTGMQQVANFLSDASIVRPTGGEEIPKGGWRAVIDTYRTKDGKAYFKFRFWPVGDYIEIDILNMPTYNLVANRNTSLHSTKRLPSDRGGWKIGFGDPTVIVNMDTARKWASKWSELTYQYIRHGTPFPKPKT